MKVDGCVCKIGVEHRRVGACGVSLGGRGGGRGTDGVGCECVAVDDVGVDLCEGCRGGAGGEVGAEVLGGGERGQGKERECEHSGWRGMGECECE